MMTTPLTLEEFLDHYSKSPNKPYSLALLGEVGMTVQDSPLRKAAKRYLDGKHNFERVLKSMGVEVGQQ